MANIVLMATMSFTVDMHYCGETLVDYSFVSQVKSCGMETMQMDSTSCDNDTISEKPCCTDEQFIKQGQEELKGSFNQFTFDQQLFFTAFTYSYLNLFENIDTRETFFQEYDPPFVERDVQILHQSFLI